MNLSSMRSKCCAALVLSLLCVSAADAKKPDKPDGGKPGEGGGGDDPTAAEQNPAIAFVSTATNGRTDVVVPSADLSSEIVLTNGLQLRKKDGYRNFGSPAWSWDGQFVAFWGQDVRDGVWSAMKLYIAAADGSDVVLIRDFSARPSSDGPDYVSCGLNWSRSGQELVYHDQQKLISIDAASGDTRVLLDGWTSGAPAANPSLSPDMDPAPGYQGWLATVGEGSTVGGSDIFIAPIADDASGYLLPVDADAFVNVTDSPLNQFHPSWSPDGMELAMFDNEDLAVLDMTSGTTRCIPGGYFTHVSAEDRATWTSDGLSLVYRSVLFGPTDLAIANSDASGAPVNYTSSSREWEDAPAWNPIWDPAGP